jgi:hypothetical protein
MPPGLAQVGQVGRVQRGQARALVRIQHGVPDAGLPLLQHRPVSVGGMTLCRSRKHDMDVTGYRVKNNRGGRCCLECARAYDRAYRKRWTRANPDAHAKAIARSEARSARVSCRLPRTTFRVLVQTVGWRGVSPTLRKLVEAFVKARSAA